jgi:hypothetical protein
LASVREAVSKCAPHEWYPIGRQLGFSHGELLAMTDKMISYSSKLGRIIDEKAAEIGEEETAANLLDSCARLVNPVIGAVRDYIKKNWTIPSS